jgi:hypothetical protein
VPPIGSITLPDGAVDVGDGLTTFDGVSYRAEGYQERCSQARPRELMFPGPSAPSGRFGLSNLR